MVERIVFDETKLGSTSRALATALLQIRSDLCNTAKMEAGPEPDGYSLVINLSSPTDDASRSLGVWLDESGVPTVEFGSWHCHGDQLSEEQSQPAQVAAVVDIVNAILHDEFVLISDVGGEHPGYTSVLDLRIALALEEELTSKYSPGCVQIKSWSGKRDGKAGLHNTQID